MVQSEIIDNTKEPLTYLYYRKVKNGKAPKNAPTYIDEAELNVNKQTNSFKKYKCTACGYIYDEAKESMTFPELPDDWVCPACGAEKGDFTEV